MEDIKQKLNEIFCDVIDDADLIITEEMTANDVDGWDSLSHLEIIVSTEKAFGIKITGAEIMRLKNIGDLINLISEKV